MKITEAIEIIKELTRGLSTTGDIKTANNMAISALSLQVPVKVIIRDWNPAKCPTCGEKLGEDLGDGYYKNYTSQKRCFACAQVLDWGDDRD